MPRKDPFMKILSLTFSFVFVSFAVPSLYGQEAPSLADLARQARSAKNKGTQTAPVNSQPAPGETSDKRSAETNIRTESGTRLNGMDIHYLHNYQDDIRKLFEQDKFEAIDQLADTARSTRARLPGGFWALHIIYAPLMLPAKGTYDTSEAEWIAQLDRLKRWVAQRPKSVTARVALAGAYLQYGWKARGGGFANTVTEDGWKLFHDRVDIAAQTLVDAFTLPTKCPEWYLTMQLVARAQDRDSDTLASIFQKAIAFEPDYQYFYRVQAESLLPKWGGEEGEMARFAGQIADRIGGKQGDIAYYQIAAFLNCACDADRQLYGMSWPRIKRGYAVVEELYGQSVLNLNQVSYMAAMAPDPAYAHELFARIGESWDEDLWRTKKYFDDTRQWANTMLEAMAEEDKATENALKAAGENLQTLEGRAFDAQVREAFAAKYNTVVANCLKYFGEGSSTPSELVLQLGKDGAVEQLHSSSPTVFSTCIALRVQSGHFPSPPKPSYWVKINPNTKR